MVMGRPNKGVDHVDRCDGSRHSKLRAKLILQTITGELSVKGACEQLGIEHPRFKELRAKLLQGGVEAMEPGRPGRPRKRDVEQQQREAELSSRVQDLERQLVVTRALAELAEVGQKKGATQRRSGGRKG